MNAAPNVTLADLAAREFVTVPEAASVLRVDARTVRSAIRSGRIPATRIAHRFRIPAAWLLAQVPSAPPRAVPCPEAGE